jgi:hypothetical protein
MPSKFFKVSHVSSRVMVNGLPLSIASPAAWVHSVEGKTIIHLGAS